MARMRLLVTGALALLLGLLLPPAAAGASWAASTAVRPVSIATGSVVPPSNVAAVLGSCSNGRWMSVTVSWAASTTAGVSGCSVLAHRSDGSTTTAVTTSASTTSAGTTVDKLSSGSTTVVFTVVTQTRYGWTAESPSSGPVTC
jgi:hypothetical protein